MIEHRDNPAHLSDEQLAAFLDGRLTAHQREWALGHLTLCSQCRREMTSARRVLARSRRAPRGWRAPVMAALAAGVVFAIVPRVVRNAAAPRVSERAPLRAAQPDRMPVVMIVSPGDRASVAEFPLAFRWRSAGKDATYRVALQDMTGSLLWEATVADTTATLDRQVWLEKGRSYFWSVDAQLADGRSARAGAHRFSVR